MYATLAECKTYSGFQFTGTAAEESILEDHLAAATSIINNKTFRSFGAATGTFATATHDFTEDNGLLLEDQDRTLWLDDDLADVPIITGSISGVTFTYIPRTAPFNRIVRSEGTWPDPTTVTGHWAYSMTPPAPIKEVCLRLFKWLYSLRESTDTDRPIVMPGGQVIMPSRLPADIESILAPYCRRHLP
jgi:hypothetical protein